MLQLLPLLLRWQDEYLLQTPSPAALVLPETQHSHGSSNCGDSTATVPVAVRARDKPGDEQAEPQEEHKRQRHTRPDQAAALIAALVGSAAAQVHGVRETGHQERASHQDCAADDSWRPAWRLTMLSIRLGHTCASEALVALAWPIARFWVVIRGRVPEFALVARACLSRDLMPIHTARAPRAMVRLGPSANGA